MSKNYYIGTMLAVMLTFSTIACNDYEAVPTSETVTESYQGSLLDYLSESHADPEMRFDSLLYLIEQYPDIKEMLTATGSKATLFAIPNRCFSSAISTLNSYRKNYKLGRELALKDFMIDPFTVVDTLIDSPGTIFADTTYIERKYDYKEQLDSLLCRYILPQEVTSHIVIDDGGAVEYASFKFGHSMQLNAGRGNASGAVNLGGRFLELIEMNGSKLQANWITGKVQLLDVKTTTGILHILSPDHEFGFNEFLKKFGYYGNEKENK